MNQLIIPEDYDILNSWVNEIHGNDSELENTTMSFKRNNQNIIGYMVVDKSDKSWCLGDGVVTNGTDNKPLIESNGPFGNCMYFFEYNYRYAVDVAKSKHLDIVGAIISLNNVLDFTDGTAISIINDNKEKFNQYIEQKIQTYNKKMQSIKNKNSVTFKKYSCEINRLSCGEIYITDFIEFLKVMSKKQKQCKIDAIRYCNIEYSNKCYNTPMYQSTMICLLNPKSVIEYFNPLNKQERDYVDNKYFKNKNS